jgi:plasmid stability protein
VVALRIELPDDEMEALRAQAKREGRSAEDAAVEAIAFWLARAAGPDPFDSAPEWLEGARRAMEEARTGKTSGPFLSEDELFHHLDSLE